MHKLLYRCISPSFIKKNHFIIVILNIIMSDRIKLTEDTPIGLSRDGCMSYHLGDIESKDVLKQILENQKIVSQLITMLQNPIELQGGSLDESEGENNYRNYLIETIQLITGKDIKDL